MKTRTLVPATAVLFTTFILTTSYALLVGDVGSSGQPSTMAANSPVSTAAAGDDDILPVADGDIYSSGTVVTNQFILVSTSVRGALEFGALDTSVYLSLHLALNAYALPFGDSTVDIYGYGNADGAITGADYNAGTFLGTLTLSPHLGYGQDALFNVTSFVRGVPGAYFGFNLRADSGSDIFSSLEYNYGDPSRLVGTPIPEPSTCVLLAIAAGSALWSARRRR